MSTLLETTSIRGVGFAGEEELDSTAGRFAIPGNGCIDVYGLNLDSHDQSIDVFEEALSARELAEVARLRQPAQRRRVAISRSTLRRIVAGYVGRPPADVPIARTRLGRPYVDHDRGGERHELHVSCSRSGPYAVFAVATGQRIGIDIEVASARTFPDQIAEIVLSREEHDRYAALDRNVRYGWLARAWVAKEAILKGLGCGLEIHPSSMTVATPFSSNAAASTVQWTSQETPFAPWWLCESTWGLSVVALAVRRRPSSLRFADLTPNR